MARNAATARLSSLNFDERRPDRRLHRSGGPIPQNATIYDIARNGGYANHSRFDELRLVGARNLTVISAVGNPAGRYPAPPAAEYMLTMVARGAGAVELDLGAGRFAARERRGDLNLSPPDTATDFIVRHPFDLLSVGLPKELMDGAFEAYGTTVEAKVETLLTRLFRDPLVEQLLRRILEEARADNPSGALFVDEAATTLAATLARAAAGPLRGPRASATLPEATIARIVELIDGALDEKLTLDRLAEASGQDAYRFARAFKATTGETPYQFALGRRLRRAKTLLRETDEPIADIALVCGFSSQSHLTSMFAKRVGATPKAYRRAFRT